MIWKKFRNGYPKSGECDQAYDVASGADEVKRFMEKRKKKL